jgi:hypothetical protein
LRKSDLSTNSGALLSQENDSRAKSLSYHLGQVETPIPEEREDRGTILDQTLNESILVIEKDDSF